MWITETDVSGNTWVLDEDAMGSDSATKVATQQSIKAYVDAVVPAEKFRTVVKSCYIELPEVGDVRLMGSTRDAGTLLEVWADTDAGTCDIQMVERAQGASDTGGSEMLTADFQADTAAGSTTSFADSAIAAKASLHCKVEAVSGATKVWVYAAFAINT